MIQKIGDILRGIELCRSVPSDAPEYAFAHALADFAEQQLRDLSAGRVVNAA